MSQQSIRILVVDDDLTTLMLMRAALEKSGFVVGLAENGLDALRQFRTEPFELIMLDVEMPGLNGYQVCAQLRKVAVDELPIIMVTGMDDLESVDQAFAAGATDFPARPCRAIISANRCAPLKSPPCWRDAGHSKFSRSPGRNR